MTEQNWNSNKTLRAWAFLRLDFIPFSGPPQVQASMFLKLVSLFLLCEVVFSQPLGVLPNDWKRQVKDDISQTI